jgi:membrane protein
MVLRGRAEQVWKLANTIYDELDRTRTFVVAAALAFYFLLALIPMLIVLSSLLGYLPVPDVFQQVLSLMRTMVPPDAMGMVEKIVGGVLTPHRGGLISFGLLTYIWAATGGHSALIEALDIAYDSPLPRSWWQNRLQALLLTFTSGALLSISLLGMMAGPHFGRWIEQLMPAAKGLAIIWPGMRWLVTFFTFVLGIELVYYLGPNVKHSFQSAFPGAACAVVGWFGGSFLLDYYIEHFAHYNLTYGSLGAVIGLMLWFYMMAVMILVGAELNAEIAKRRKRIPSLPDDPMSQPIPGIHNA